MKATRRRGKPYVHVTWLAKALAQPECLYSYWFRAHHEYKKCEEMTGDLQRWNREHNELMRERVKELEEMGFKIYREGACEFKLEGSTAVLGGKPDIVGQLIDLEKPKRSYTLIVDGKTGVQRDSDLWQVKIYEYALPICRKDLIVGQLKGEVQYRTGDVRKPVALTEDDKEKIFAMIRALASDAPPAKAPSRDECRWCNIGIWDCPERVNAPTMTGTAKDF